MMPDEALEYSSHEVTAIFESVEIRERTFVNVPVVPLIGSAADDIEVSPPVVSVVVAGPVAELQGLSMSDITVTVVAESADDRHGPQIPEVSLPARIRLVSVDPQTVVFVSAEGRFQESPTTPR